MLRPHPRSDWRRAAGAGILLVALSGCEVRRSEQIEPRPTGEPEPLAESLPTDPALNVTELSNGLRIVHLERQRPAGRCSLQLVVHVGSLDERDDELGMAHFVEHLAFNGTRRFPDQAIHEWFMAQGIRTGRHVNAATSYESTVYHIDSRSSDADSLRDALDVLHQFATAITFEPAGIDQEKRVIDAEQRERSRAATHVDELIGQSTSAGSRVARRQVLGTPACRAEFTAASLRAFYERWYRPDNMTLVAVGDIAPNSLFDLCRATLGTTPLPSTKLPDRAPRTMPYLPLAQTVSDAVGLPGATETICFIQCAEMHPATDLDRNSIAREVQHEATARMMATALASELTGPGRRILSVEASPARDGPGFEAHGFGLKFRWAVPDPEAALHECATAASQIVERGFRPDQLDDLRRQALREIDRELRRWTNATNAESAARLARTLGKGEVPPAIELLLQIRRSAWEVLELADCNANLRSTSAIKPRFVTIGPVSCLANASAIWTAGTATAIAPSPNAPPVHAGAPRCQGTDPWPYAAAETGPVPIARRHDPDLDYHDARFENGVRVLIKRRVTDANEVRIAVNFGRGIAAVSADARATAILLEKAHPRAGLARVPNRELRRLALQADATVRFRMEPARCVLVGQTTRAGQLFLLEWLAADVTEPSVDATVLRDVGARTADAQRRGRDSVDARVWAFLSHLAGQALAPDPEAIARVTMEKIDVLLDRSWRRGPITLAIVGDVDVEETLRLVARTFGRLASRTTRAPRRPPANDREFTITHESHDLAASTRAGLVLLAAQLDATANQPPAVRVLMSVLDTRLRALVREQLGLSYDPSVSAMWLGTKHRSNVLLMRVPTPPGQEHVARAASQGLLATLCREAPSTAEVDAARRRLATDQQEELDDNEGWVRLLSDEHEAGVAATLASRRGVASVTPDDVHAAARRLLAADRISTLVLRSHAQTARYRSANTLAAYAITAAPIASSRALPTLVVVAGASKSVSSPAGSALTLSREPRPRGLDLAVGLAAVRRLLRVAGRPRQSRRCPRRLG